MLDNANETYRTRFKTVSSISLILWC